MDKAQPFLPVKETSEREESDVDSSESSPPKREAWANNVEFLLSLVGYSVAFGNIQRFPYLCAKNGGGAFLIPYMFFLLTCGIPLYYLEVCLGQFSGHSPIHAWKISPLFSGLGVLMMTVSAVCCWYYNTLIAWSIFYLVNSFQSLVPWSTCGNWWNTNECRGIFIEKTPVNESYLFLTNSTENSTESIVWKSGNVSSSLQFWQGYVLRLSTGLHDMGIVQYHMVLSLLGAWLLVFFCMVKGVKSLGKVVYVTALLPYFLFIAFLIRGLTLPGSVDGILFYLTPDFNKILSGQVWLEAAVQVFFSLGPAWGGVITMSSYTRFNNDCLRTSLLVTITEGMTSFMFGFAVFTTVGFMANELQQSVADVAQNEPGLIFISYPECIGKLPLPQLWAVLFWIMMITVGLDTEFGMFETFSSGIVEAFPKQLAKKKMLVVGLICTAFFVLGLPLTTRGGIYVYQLIDWYSAAFSLILCACLECFIIGWCYGADRFSRDVELMTGRSVPVPIRICWCIVSPALLLLVFITMLWDYATPVYNGYVYPDWSIAIGILIGLLPIIPLVIGMAYQLWKAEGNIIDRLRSSACVQYDWLPREEELWDEYRKQDSLEYHSFLDRLKANLLGTNRVVQRIIVKNDEKCV